MKVFKSPYKNWNFAHIADINSVCCYMLYQGNLISSTVAKTAGISLKLFNMVLMSDERIDAGNKIDGILSNISQLLSFYYLGSESITGKNISSGLMCFSLALKLLATWLKDYFPNSLGLNRNLAGTFFLAHKISFYSMYGAYLMNVAMEVLNNNVKPLDGSAWDNKWLEILTGIMNIFLTGCLVNDAFRPLEFGSDDAAPRRMSFAGA